MSVVLDLSLVGHKQDQAQVPGAEHLLFPFTQLLELEIKCPFPFNISVRIQPLGHLLNFHLTLVKIPALVLIR
jgi:hypothetical protein